MDKKIFAIGAILAGIAVAVGAYGAHGGAQYMTEETAITFGKAVKYQMHHALGLLAIGLAMTRWTDQKKILKLAAFSLLGGIVTFSGSLYIIVFADIKMGYVTPLGGTLFVLGWFLLAYAAWKSKITK